MAIKIKFDSAYNTQPPTLILATRKGRKIGKLPAHNIKFKDGLNTDSEITFSVYKVECVKNISDDKEKENNIWGQIKDFKLVWCKEYNLWYEIYVDLEESNDLVKNISAISLGEAELSQINLYNIEINTETDIERDDYSPTVLFNKDNPNISLLNRIMEKAPHYIIKHVDTSIASIQRTFTFDNKSLYDAFQEISEEINCLFAIDCYSDNYGNIVREINVYDLEATCLNCGERGEFLSVCSKCGSDNILTGYGEDTSIFVSTDNLADNITYTTDNGSVKNCFKLEAGDDLMTATIVNCNPNGSAYIWYISEDIKEDMSSELVKKIEKYNEDYVYYQNTYPINISGNVLNTYNNLVKKYQTYTNDYSEIHSSIAGYSTLMEVYYNTIDFYLFLNNNFMPSVKKVETNATKEAAKLTGSSLSPIAVSNLSTCSNATADSAVLAMAKTIVNGSYQVKITESTFSNSTWNGVFTITNYSDEEDTANSNRITIRINDNYEDYVKQKINKALRQSITEDEITDVVQLFGLSNSAFINELKKYSLSRLTSFHDNCQSCIDILTEQGVANSQTWANNNPNLYTSLYIPYYNKLGYIEAEMKVREDEIAVIIGKYDNNGGLIANGIQSLLDVEREKIHKNLNFEKYIGHDLWLEFAAYRREDTYKNDNYISDGLNNAELFKNARQFIEMAQKEIYKSATLQHSITATLKNLLVMKEFRPIVDYFEIGNWIRIRIDNNIYRLRLLEYEIDFEDLSNIHITFSDVIVVSNGTSDLNSILNQASNMSSSYDSTKRQAEKGSASKKWMDNWVQRGLDATNVKIVSNADNQNQTWDSHGMLFREYSPITDSYDDCQLKIINSTLAITDDNWKSVKTAVGGFYYFDPVSNKLTYDYGINAEVLVGKLILGESLGIYSENNSLTFDKNGLIITNNTNSFSVNPNNTEMLTLSNKTGNILWVDKDGTLHIVGDMVARTGTIGGWDIGNTTISQTRILNDGTVYDVYLANYSNDGDNSRVFHCAVNNTDTFSVRRNGKFYASDAEIHGTIIATRLEVDNARIGGFDIDDGSIIYKGGLIAEYNGDHRHFRTIFKPASFDPDKGEDGTAAYTWVFSCQTYTDIPEYEGYGTKYAPTFIIYADGTLETNRRIYFGESSGINQGAKEGTSINLINGRDGTVIVGDFSQKNETQLRCGSNSKVQCYLGSQNRYISFSNETTRFSGTDIDTGVRNVLRGYGGGFVITAGDGSNALYLQGSTVNSVSNFRVLGSLNVSGTTTLSDSLTVGGSINGFSLATEETEYPEVGATLGNRRVIRATGAFVITANSGNNALYLQGSTVYALSNFRTTGNMTVDGSSSLKGDLIVSGDAVKFNVAGTNVYFSFSNEAMSFSGTNIASGNRNVLRGSGGGLVITAGDGSNALYLQATTTHVVSNFTVYGTARLSSGEAIASDARMKNNIAALTDDSRYEKLFNSLKPVTHKYNDGQSGRTHMGFIAQDLKQALIDAGFTTEEIAAYVEFASDKEGFDGYECAVRYNELIPLDIAMNQKNSALVQKCFAMNQENSAMIQKCFAKIFELQQTVNSLKGE